MHPPSKALENASPVNGNMMDPEKILASPDILEKIDAVCKRQFSAENDQNECYVFVIDSLRADHFKRLKAFKGNSKLSTYLLSLTNSLLVDFRRKRYGRRRIPAAVSKLGEWAEATYRLVCWQRFSFDDAYDFLCIDGLYENDYYRFMRDIVPIQKARCRENPTFQPLDGHGADPRPNLEDSGPNPLEALIQKLDRERRLKAIEVIRETTTKLSEKDQLLVKLVYGSEQSVRVAAKVVGLSASAARRRLRKLLIKYKESLLAVGIRNS